MSELEPSELQPSELKPSELKPSDSESSIYLAIDLGAGSGRVIAGSHSTDKLHLEDVHRFTNEPIEIDGHLHWNWKQLTADIMDGLGLAVKKYGADNICGIGVDTWGVDHGLYNKQGELMGQPFNYRDVRNQEVYDDTLTPDLRDLIFSQTGVQFMAINTLYQMGANVRDENIDLDNVAHFLMVPDIMNYQLTGKAVCERTNASTTQFYNPKTNDWATDVLEAFGWPADKVPPFVDAGTSLGPILPEVATATGLHPNTPVFVVGSHDTASAVAAVPVHPGSKFAYLSSGTWSLLGAEIDAPIISQASQTYNFTNEVGVFDTIRLLKNITGLWLVQECQRVWSERGEKLDFAELTRMTEQAAPLVSFIDPDDPRFATRGDMPTFVREACRDSGQVVPEGRDAVLRTITESLALKYRVVLEWLEALTGTKVERLHVIGGGGKNELLNQCIANSIERPVEVGPYEATAAGNVMMQLVASGALSSLEEGRALIRKSYGTKVFEPQADQAAAWADARERSNNLLHD